MWIICCGLHTQSHCSHQHHPWHREFRWFDSAPVTFSWRHLMCSPLKQRHRRKKSCIACCSTQWYKAVWDGGERRTRGRLDYAVSSSPPWKCPLTSTTSRSIVISSCFFFFFFLPAGGTVLVPLSPSGHSTDLPCQSLSQWTYQQCQIDAVKQSFWSDTWQCSAAAVIPAERGDEAVALHVWKVHCFSRFGERNQNKTQQHRVLRCLWDNMPLV